MIIVTKNGTSVDSNLTDDEAADLCVRIGSHFADSLVKAQRSKRMTAEQRAWMHVLAVRSVDPSQDSRGKSRENSASANGVTLPAGRLVELFERSTRRLEWPRMRLTLVEFCWNPRKRSLTIWQRAPRRLLGAVAGGELILQGSLPPSDVMAQMRAALEDPTTVGKAHGVTVGWCCFCGLKLTDARSVGNGYGPICAESWGLPWDGTVDAMIEQAKRIKSSLDEMEQSQ